jgi:hypothetical protein
MVALGRFLVDHSRRADLTMATTTKAKDDDDDKQMTSTIPLPPLPPTATTTKTTATTTTTNPVPPTTPNKFKDLPPLTQDRQSSGGHESSVTLASTSFNPAEPSTNTLFLPLPNPSTNKSRSSFVLSDDELPPEIANADISIASELTLLYHLNHIVLQVSKESLDLHTCSPFGRGKTARTAARVNSRLHYFSGFSLQRVRILALSVPDTRTADSF